MDDYLHRLFEEYPSESEKNIICDLHGKTISELRYLYEKQFKVDLLKTCMMKCFSNSFDTDGKRTIKIELVGTSWDKGINNYIRGLSYGEVMINGSYSAVGYSWVPIYVEFCDDEIDSELINIIDKRKTEYR